MQLASAPSLGTWIHRPDLTGTSAPLLTTDGTAVAVYWWTGKVERIARDVLDLFDQNGDGVLGAHETTRSQQLMFGSDAAGTGVAELENGQLFHRHSTIRQEVLSIAPLHAAAAGADGLATVAGLTAAIARFDHDRDGIIQRADFVPDQDEVRELLEVFGPRIDAARQLTVEGRLLGPSSDPNGPSVRDPWLDAPRG